MGSRRWRVDAGRAGASRRDARPVATPQGATQVKVILAAGAFIAIERRDRRIEAMLRVLHEQRVPLWTSAAVIAQVWRNGRKQALLARILPGIRVRALAPGDDTRIGEL